MSTERLPRVFYRHLAASGSSNFGDGMVMAAAPLLALTLTDDARLIAAVGFAMMLPWLLLSLQAGVLIDRYERRRILVVANTTRAVLFAVLALAVATGTATIWILLALVFLMAVCEVFFDMGAQAFLPSIVEERHLERANGRLFAVEVATGSFLGLPFGAWLFVVAAAAPFGMQAVALAAAAVLIAGIRPIASHVPGARSTAFRAELREGFTWLWRHRLLRTLALMLGMANMCHMFAQSVFAKFVRDELGLGPRGFGLLLAAGAIGAILGGLVGERVAKRLGPATAIVTSYAMFAALEVLPGAFPRVWVVVVASVAMAVFGTVWNVLTVSMRQRLIPAELFGRVNSVYRFLGTGTSAIGALIGGQIAYHLGLRATYFVSAATLGLMLVIGGPVLLRHARHYAAASTA